MNEKKENLSVVANCAGCSAKVGAGTLSRLLEGIGISEDPNLLVGFDKNDDASVYKINENLALVQTIDFFPPLTEDPYLYGQIAAVNAISDIYAMGAEPKLALNMLCIPQNMSQDLIKRVLQGSSDKAREVGVTIAGGHSIFDENLKYGLAVTGFVHPDKILTNSAAQPGDVLFLTKPLGIGVLISAFKADLCKQETKEEAFRLMTTLNRSARDAMVKYRVHACTDVTGFGLLGHAYEMAKGSGVGITFQTEAVQWIPEALELSRLGILPEGMYRNRAFAEAGVDAGKIELAVQDLLYDPQTSGGLLIAVHPEDADDLYAELKNTVPCAQRIGNVRSCSGPVRIWLE